MKEKKANADSGRRVYIRYIMSKLRRELVSYTKGTDAAPKVEKCFSELYSCLNVKGTDDEE